MIHRASLSVYAKFASDTLKLFLVKTPIFILAFSVASY